MPMKGLLFIVLLASVSAWAQSPFDGTWRIELKNAQLSQKPETYALQNGTFSCSTCAPPIEVKADGQDQKVSGYPYFDTLSVRVVNDNTVEQTAKKNGKVVGTEKDTLSDNGNRLTINFKQHPEGSEHPVTGNVIMTRVSKGPAGSHAMSGSWRTDKVQDVSANGLTMTLKSSGNGLSFTSPIGMSYQAQFDGKDYPVKGNPGVTSVSLNKIDANTMEETQKRDGKIVGVNRYSVAPDGKSMKIVFNDKLRDTTDTVTAHKQ